MQSDKKYVLVKKGDQILKVSSFTEFREEVYPYLDVRKKQSIKRISHPTNPSKYSKIFEMWNSISCPFDESSEWYDYIYIILSIGK